MPVSAAADSAPVRALWRDRRSAAAKAGLGTGARAASAPSCCTGCLVSSASFRRGRLRHRKDGALRPPAEVSDPDRLHCYLTSIADPRAPVPDRPNFRSSRQWWISFRDRASTSLRPSADLRHRPRNVRFGHLRRRRRKQNDDHPARVFPRRGFQQKRYSDALSVSGAGVTASPAGGVRSSSLRLRFSSCFCFLARSRWRFANA